MISLACSSKQVPCSIDKNSFNLGSNGSCLSKNIMVIFWEYAKLGNLRNAYLFKLLKMVAFAKYEAIPVAEMCIYT